MEPRGDDDEIALLLAEVEGQHGGALCDALDMRPPLAERSEHLQRRLDCRVDHLDRYPFQPCCSGSVSMRDDPKHEGCDQISLPTTVNEHVADEYPQGSACGQRAPAGFPSAVRGAPPGVVSLGIVSIPVVEEIRICPPGCTPLREVRTPLRIPCVSPGLSCVSPGDSGPRPGPEPLSQPSIWTS